MAARSITVEILKDIRGDLREVKEDVRSVKTDVHDLKGFAEEQGRFNEDLREHNRAALERFEVIETTLRDFAQQLVVLTRAIKVMFERRAEGQDRVDDHERRIAVLEARDPKAH